MLSALLAGTVAVGCGGGGADVHSASQGKCPSNPLLGVYDPSRLEVRQQCLWFRGTVVDLAPREDGDLHVDIAPAPGYERYLNKGNEKDQGGSMVMEIMPDQALPVLMPGEHVAVLGTWVHDTHNDWNEIHPVWTIDYLDRGGRRVTSLPPRTPVYTGDAND